MEQSNNLNKEVKRFTSSNLSWVLSFIWGLSEGIFFFIVPDVIVAYIALNNRKKGFYSLIASIIGSLLSAIIVFYLTAHYNMVNFLLNIPLITQSLISGVQQQLSLHGVSAVLSGPFSGVPYKIYSVEAALSGISLPSFLSYSILSRLSRMLPVVVLTSIIGIIFKKKITENPKITIIIYSLIWILIYVLYALFLLK